MPERITIPHITARDIALARIAHGTPRPADLCGQIHFDVPGRMIGLPEPIICPTWPLASLVGLILAKDGTVHALFGIGDVTVALGPDATQAARRAALVACRANEACPELAPLVGEAVARWLVERWQDTRAAVADVIADQDLDIP